MNERWSLDFVHDTLASGRRIRALTTVDDYTHESLAEAREIIEIRRLDYNAQRPHSSLGNRTPEEFVRYLINSQPSPLFRWVTAGALVVLESTARSEVGEHGEDCLWNDAVSRWLRCRR